MIESLSYIKRSMFCLLSPSWLGPRSPFIGQGESTDFYRARGITKKEKKEKKAFGAASSSSSCGSYRPRIVWRRWHHTVVPCCSRLILSERTKWSMNETIPGPTIAHYYVQALLCLIGLNDIHRVRQMVAPTTLYQADAEQCSPRMAESSAYNTVASRCRTVYAGYSG